MHLRPVASPGLARRLSGDLECSALRPGNVHSADGWDGTLKPVVVRYRGKVSRIYFRADAAFAMPEVYEYLEAEGADRRYQFHFLSPSDFDGFFDALRAGESATFVSGLQGALA